MRKTGTYEQLGSMRYFIPDQLPPKDPIFIIDVAMNELYGEAMHHLGKLNEIADRLPSMQRFIKAYIIKEALLSSAIEGVHTTLMDVFTQPFLADRPKKDTQLVLNYTKALGVALSMMRDEGLPIISNLICKAHEVLMQLGHGDKANPGNFRKQSVKVGNLIPPPPLRIPDLMADLERYINLDDSLAPLIKAGLAHVQFETIHPFLDGNGRIGRLLIVLILIDNGLIAAPILYPSYYFKKHHLEYYLSLDRVRTHGDFEGWIVFYLKAIKETAVDAYQRAKDIEQLEQELKEIVATQKRSHAIQEMRRLALTILFSHPVINIKTLSAELKVAYNTASNIIVDFVKLGILIEETGQKRSRLFRFKAYVELLEKEYPVAI